MVLSIEEFKSMLLYSCNLLEENIDALTDLDLKFGDGEHGLKVKKICNTIRKTIDNYEEENLKGLLAAIGENIMGINGGSVSQLWGTLIEGLSEGVNEVDKIDEEAIKDMLLAALINMQLITNAGVGDKTMMDVLIPVVRDSRSCQGDVDEILETIRDSAFNGAESTKNYVAKYGKAKFYKEQTVGYMDVGAMALQLFFKGWRRIL